MEYIEYFDRIRAASRDTVCTLSNTMAVAPQPITRLVALFDAASATNNKVILFGNGGSMSACAHMANDLCLGGIKALDLGSVANMSCLANDVSFESVFARQLEWFANDGDVVVMLSCSGRSKNVLAAITEARNKKDSVVTMSGFDSHNPLRKMGDLNFYVPSRSYGFVQMTHEAILHCAIDVVGGWKP